MLSGSPREKLQPLSDSRETSPKNPKKLLTIFPCHISSRRPAGFKTIEESLFESFVQHLHQTGFNLFKLFFSAAVVIFPWIFL